MTEEERKEQIEYHLAALKELRATPRSDWHAGFEALLKIETFRYEDKVRIRVEEEIGVMPPRTDFIILVEDERVLSNYGILLNLIVAKNPRFFSFVKGEMDMKEVLMEMVKDRVEEKANERADERERETKISAIESLMINLKLTLEQAMEALSIPQSQWDTYAGLIAKSKQ